METFIAANFKRNLGWLKNQFRRIIADDLIASLGNGFMPSNRADRRALAKHVRRTESASRVGEREIREKRAWRAWRKTRRVVRLTRAA